MNSLDLGIVGNSSISALVTAGGEICWACMPRVDADAVFCSLLRERRDEMDFGFLAVELEGMARAEQHYLPHTLFAPAERQNSVPIHRDRFNPDLLRFFICENKVCNLPVTGKGDALKLIQHASQS